MLMIHSIKQTNLSQILSKNGFKSSFITSTVFVKKNEHVLGLLLFVLTVAFWDYRIAILEALLEKDKGPLCRICLYFAWFNFSSVPNQYLTFLSIKIH